MFLDCGRNVENLEETHADTDYMQTPQREALGLTGDSIIAKQQSYLLSQKTKTNI